MENQFKVRLSVDKQTGEPELTVTHGGGSVEVNWMAVRDLRVNRANCTIEAASLEVGFGPGAFDRFCERREETAEMTVVPKVHYRPESKRVGQRTACGFLPEDLVAKGTFTHDEELVTCTICRARMR